jgi:hypothetical protein
VPATVQDQRSFASPNEKGRLFWDSTMELHFSGYPDLQVQKLQFLKQSLHFSSRHNKSGSLAI